LSVCSIAADTQVPSYQQKNVQANPEMYLQTLMAYIDKSLPVIRYFYGWGVFVGYEDYGKTLLYMTADNTEPERVPYEALFVPQYPAFADHTPETVEKWAALHGYGWCFVGERKRSVDIPRLYREVIADMPRLLTVKNEAYAFGAGAFRAWADEIEGGRFDGMEPAAFGGFDDWALYKIYVCNVATNGSCRAFLERALEKNPDMAFLGQVIERYRMLAALWNGSAGQVIENLESLGGGFNVTLEALQNPQKRAAIARKIRVCAAVMDEVVEILRNWQENRPL